jgi:hypothetical protein
MPAVTIRSPAGPKRAPETVFVWPRSRRVCRPSPTPKTRAVEDREPRRAQVPGDDLLLLLAAEEGRGVALAVRDEADEGRFLEAPLRRRRRGDGCRHGAVTASRSSASLAT